MEKRKKEKERNHKRKKNVYTSPESKCKHRHDRLYKSILNVLDTLNKTYLWSLTRSRHALAKRVYTTLKTK